jgi:hypothetical protein
MKIYCKTSLLVKWEQNRKTQEMIDRINNIKGLSKKTKERLIDIKTDEIKIELVLNKVNGTKKLDKEVNYNNRIFNVIFCNNSLLLVTQTYKRTIKDGLIVEQLSSAKDANWHNFSDIKANWEEYIGDFAENKDRIDGYLCCGHPTRLNDALNLVKFFDKYRKGIDNMKFRFWFDEADVTVAGKNQVKIVNEIRSSESVEEVVFITATPQERNGGLITLYGELDIHPLTIPTDTTTYLQWKEISKDIIEQDRSMPLTHYVLKCLKLKPLIKGDLLFVPGDNTKRSHEEIAKMLFQQDMADKVFVINGDNKEIQLWDSDGDVGYCCLKDDLKEEEFSKYLQNNCYATNLEDDDPENCINCRVAITGRICISRGITINNPNKCITRSIIGETSLRWCKRMDSQYSQLGGRLGGNIKKWENYIPPFIQTTQNIDEAINIQRNMTQWLQEQDKICLSQWEEQYYKECLSMGIREGKSHKYGTYLFKFKDINDLKKFIPFMNKWMKPEIGLQIKGPTKRTIERKRINGKLPYRWDYKPKLAVRDETFIYDKKQLRMGFYAGSFDDSDLKKVKSKKAGRAIPYISHTGREMWCYVTPEKYYKDDIKKYNDNIVWWTLGDNPQPVILNSAKKIGIKPAFK